MLTADESQALRLRILRTIYELSEGIVKQTIYASKYREELKDIDLERLNGELHYLVDSGYIIKVNQLAHMGTIIVNDISLSSSGLDLIHKIEQNRPLGNYANDFSPAAIQIFNVKVKDSSNVVVGASNFTVSQTNIENDIKAILEFLDAVASSDDRAAANIAVSAKKEIEEKGLKDSAKGMLTALLSIGSGVVIGLLTAGAKAALASQGIVIP